MIRQRLASSRTNLEQETTGLLFLFSLIEIHLALNVGKSTEGTTYTPVSTFESLPLIRKKSETGWSLSHDERQAQYPK